MYILFQNKSACFTVVSLLTTHMQKKNIDSTFGLSGERQGIDSMNQSSTFHPLQVIWDSDSDTEDSSMGKQTETTRSDQKQTVGGT